MKWLLLSAGKPALAYARSGRDEYLQRINYFAKFEHQTIKASDPQRESSQFLDRSQGYRRLVLEEKGTQVTSRQLATKLDNWREAAIPVAVIIGGANGHHSSLIQAADFTWSLGTLTLQHELALVIVLEQIYRAHTILQGHPYHRD